MKLRYSPRAREDIAAIGRYIRERNPVGARALGNAFRNTLSMLAKYPHAGRIVGSAGLHRFAVPRLPYLVFYVADELTDTLRIVTVRHVTRREEN